MKEHLQAIITILALVNPAMCMAIYIDCVKNLSREEKERAALKAVSAIGIVLFIAAIAGVPILGAFGISLNAFKCAGGGILILIGLSMLKSTQSDTKSGAVSTRNEGSSLTSLILFAASPGTITGVITVAAAHEKRVLPLTAMVGVFITLVILLVAFLLAIRVSGVIGKVGLVKELVTSYMGVIVIAMGVQFIMNGTIG